MNTLNSINCRSFMLCVGSMSPNDSLEYTNTGLGMVNHLMYMHTGSGAVKTQNGLTISLEEGNVYDLSSYANTPLTYESGLNGAHYLIVDPLPNDKLYDYELLKGSAQKTIVGNDTEQVILCVYGTASCNGKNISETQYARVLSGKTVDITVPDNSAVIILKAR